MAKKDEKRPVSFRLSRQCVGLLEQYTRDNNVTKTEAIERAVKMMCRVGNEPATHKDIAELSAVIAAGFKATQEKIDAQPIAAIEAKKERKGWLRRLLD